MNGWIDIHSHLLPGIDDGAKDIQITLEMFRIAKENGIKTMIMTPHFKPMRHNASPEKIAGLISRIEEVLRREKIDIQLYTGNEIYYHSEAVLKIEEKEVCTMANSDYVLTEFNPMDEYDYIRKGIYQVISGGYRPILAHAERYESVSKSVEHVEDLIQMGCYIQLNAGSIMGQIGFGKKQFCKQLLKHRLVHFVATDAHDTKKRAPQLKECAKYIGKKCGADYVKELLYENPMRIIQNEYI